MNGKRGSCSHAWTMFSDGVELCVFVVSEELDSSTNWRRSLNMRVAAPEAGMNLLTRPEVYAF